MVVMVDELKPLGGAAVCEYGVDRHRHLAHLGVGEHAHTPHTEAHDLRVCIVEFECERVIECGRVGYGVRGRRLPLLRRQTHRHVELACR